MSKHNLVYARCREVYGEVALYPLFCNFLMMGLEVGANNTN
jgi:hypothetical protein